MASFPKADQFTPLFSLQELLPPRDIAPTPFTCWERGGTALADTSAGIDVRNWFFECDADTGEVFVSAPADGIAASLVHTISPLPVQFTGSFDLTMRPVIAWVDVNGDSFIRFWNGSAYTVTQLAASCRNLRLCIDDVRDQFFAFGDTESVLAYTRHNSLFVRLGSESYANERLIQAGGFPTLFQIGMTTELRFQFARSGEQMEATTPLMYMRPSNRADKLIGFDSLGRVELFAALTTGTQGAAGPKVSYNKTITGAGQTFFLRGDDGTWDNTEFQVTVDFYSESGDALRARRVLTFNTDAHGNISRVTNSTAGEASLLIEEAGAGTRTYTMTISTREAKHGVTFNIVSVSALPTFGTFSPDWNASRDFYGGRLMPTGRIAYADFGTYVTLSAADSTGYTARSTSTAMRWAAGSLPLELRPAATRAVACTLSNNGQMVAGVAEFYPNGGAQFWPLQSAGTLLVKGSFVKSDHVVREKGLPATWQVTYAKVAPSGFAFPPTITDVDPAAIQQLSGDTLITVTGTEFVTRSFVAINGTPIATTFNSETELEATIPSAMLAAIGQLDVTVVTPHPGGGTSNTLQITVAEANPVPVLTSISPTNINEDSSGFTLTLTGTGFLPDSIVRWDGGDLATTYVSPTELQATVTAELLAAAGTADVTVFNPAPGGGTSDAQTFTINAVAALTRTNLLQRRGTGASTSFTPPNNSLLVVVVGVCRNSGSVDPSSHITLGNSAGLTFTPRVTIGSAVPWSRGVRIYTAPVTTGVSMTVTPGLSEGTIHTMDIHVFAYTNYDTASPVGATASANNLDSGGPRSIVLSAAPASSSEVLAVMHANCTAASDPIDAGSGWTEQYDNGGANIQQQTQTRTGSTSTTVEWADIGATFGAVNIGAAIEIKRAP